jgi:tetratricopeptide (TPR) repeat protein
MLGLSAAEAPQRSIPKAAEAATKALRLDDGLAEAHTSLAAVKSCYEWDLGDAEAEYLRSLALDSSYATTFHWRGLLCHAALGRFALATDDLEQAIELDPLSPPIIADLALVHAFREDFDAAAMYCHRALELDPHFHRPYWFLGLTFAWSNDYPAAEEALKRGLELCPGTAFRSRLLGALGFVYGQWEKPHLAQAVTDELNRMRETSYAPAFELAQIQLGRSDAEGALASLEQAVEGRESFGIFLSAWLSFRPLRAEPRFQSLLTRIGLGS